EVELISTGGTARVIKSEGLPVTDVTEITGFPESLGGRVKTLHPHLLAAILARTSHPPDMEELADLGIKPIELVVVNLYPFLEVAGNDTGSLAEATEYIDIGGPTMVRAAAKNFGHVCVLTDPGRYDQFIAHFDETGGVSFDYRHQQARIAFNHTARYETDIANYFNLRSDKKNPVQLNIALPLSQELRYGENPHQQAALYGEQKPYIDCFHGKQLSYNNYLDLDAALALIADFGSSEPTCAIFKHTIPCGVASADTLSAAWDKAFRTDRVSPYGGIVVVNRELNLEVAEAIDDIFTEIIIAPSFTDDAASLLVQKKNRRLIRLLSNPYPARHRQFRSIFGGALQQENDQTPYLFKDYEVVSRRKPDEREIRDLMFAWRVVKHVKSNAVVYVRERQTIGIGTGQPSRVDSSEAALRKASKEGHSTTDTVVASDAFFPFADGVEVAAEAGATAVIQPGGSIRDEQVIEMADKHDLAMVFTGKRHFRH
ncbi:MAG: bifunctional phosphoribosylaminoimidazolecarboxamide formyltransferase/IMP cyclohydrolase, partial [Balneolaceae bacterium]|nr:bifunctional phosphoribosylaminoimidazolecarboxamide formyltransferase/IMP cyclohydrolase [Balneolaceae bacterium]